MLRTTVSYMFSVVIICVIANVIANAQVSQLFKNDNAESIASAGLVLEIAKKDNDVIQGVPFEIYVRIQNELSDNLLVNLCSENNSPKNMYIEYWASGTRSTGLILNVIANRIIIPPHDSVCFVVPDVVVFEKGDVQLHLKYSNVVRKSKGNDLQEWEGLITSNVINWTFAILLEIGRGTPRAANVTGLRTPVRDPSAQRGEDHAIWCWSTPGSSKTHGEQFFTA